MSIVLSRSFVFAVVMAWEFATASKEWDVIPMNGFDAVSW